MTNFFKSVIFSVVCTCVVVFLGTCNIFGKEPYVERNINGFVSIPLVSPQHAADSTEMEITGDRTVYDGSLNRLAFGVSSRRITRTALPVPVYRANPAIPFDPDNPMKEGGGIRIDTSFMPWGNIIMDSVEDVPGFEVDPRKGAGRQIVLTAVNETNNAGKIAGSEDGISYYFRRVPKDINFRISADFYVDVYGFTNGRAELNGQEAFGFMARDWIPQHTNAAISEARPGFPDGIPASGGAPYDLTEKGLKTVEWNGVYWNGQDTSLNDGVASSSNMIMVGGVKRGMRVYWRTGVTDPDREKKPVTDFNTIANADFAKFDYKPRELSDYSIYGSGIAGTMKRPDFPTAGLTYKLYLEKTNSGFVAKIEPPKGVGKGTTKNRVPSDGFVLEYTDRELPFPDLLCGPNSVERDHYYIGFFAARDAMVTVTNFRYEESPADMCPPRIEPEPEPVVPSFLVQSPNATSVEKYTLYGRSNVEGVLMLSVNGGEQKVYRNEWVVETTNASARPFSLFTVEDISLNEGDNLFDMVFIPDNKQLNSGFLGFDKNGNPLPPPIEYLMTDIKPITRSFIVNRRSLNTGDYFPLSNNAQDYYGDYGPRFKREVIWVAPDGKANGTGSYENPLDLKTAITVSAVTPESGQMIILKDGIYTPTDPPEMIDGGMRIPIRLIVPRYNSGRPNNDPGAPAAPHVRPAPDNNETRYPDPYADEYYRYYKVLKAENRNMAIIDFRKDLRNSGYAPRNFEMNGNHWIIDGIHVRNAEDTYGGLRTHGSHNLFRWIKTYFNGDSGLWVSGKSDEPKSMWPTNVRIEYCESFGNIDQARTNADGFAAKLTTWENIIFYRCISHHNTDDGWDLFAKKETGPIGAVRIEQSFAYSNGRYLNDEVGRNYSEEAAIAKMNYSAGVGGNGFKMGGEGIPITHLVINSITWGNDGDGVTSNSDPAIRITHVSAFDNYNRVDSNPGSNFAVYSSSSPSYEGLEAIATQVLSWRSVHMGSRNDRLEPKSPSSGFVWRNYNTGHEWGIYDANNGKETSIVDLSKPGEAKQFMLFGKSVSTLYVEGKYDQSRLTYPGSSPAHYINPNGSRVNRYIDSRVLSSESFVVDPVTQFSYGVIDENTLAFKDFKRGIYFNGDGGEQVSPWEPLKVNGKTDEPYRRLDGSVPKTENRNVSGKVVSVGLANHPQGRIHGDFLEIYDETNASSAYFIGLPKLYDFMRLKEGSFFGVTPGAAGLWN